MDINEFIKMAFERKKIIIILMFITVLTGVLVNYLFKPVFESKTTFVVLGVQEVVTDPKKINLNTYVNFIQNNTLRKSVYDELDIFKNYDIDFDTFKEKFIVMGIKDSAIIHMFVQFEDPEMCVKISEKVAEKVIILNENIIKREVESSLTFADEQVKDAYEELLKSFEALNDFHKGINTLEEITELNILSSRLTSLSEGDNVSFPTFSGLGSVMDRPSPIISEAQDNRVNLRIADEKIIELKAQLDLEQPDNKQLQIKKDMNFYQNARKLLLEEIKKIKKAIAEKEDRFQQDKLAYSILWSNNTIMSDSYAKMLSSFHNMKASIIAKTKKIEILDKPIKPENKIFPKLTYSILAGIFLGIVLNIFYLIFSGLFLKIDND